LTVRDKIVLGHGSGGHLSANLLRDVFLPLFSNPVLDRLDDQAILDIGGMRLAFTTDSFVVKPLFFPGGDIGSLAVHGTVNDLAMGGATPLFLSAAFIIEEGFPIEMLQRVAASMSAAAAAACVSIVTGDTKVVERGKGDGVFISTTGIGVVAPGVRLSKRLDRRSWHGHHGEPRRFGIRDHDCERFRGVARSCRGHACRLGSAAVSARSNARRPFEHSQ
jgi:hydrogenase expression/formation protein HypE